MIPDLGKYAGVVLASYAVAIVLLAALVAISLWQGARVRAALRAVEDRVAGATGARRDE
jgi:heme exporter protein D